MNKNEQIKEAILNEEELDNQTQIKNEIKVRRKKRKIGKIISSIIFSILFLFIIFEAGIGILNMQRISDEKRWKWNFVF